RNGRRRAAEVVQPGAPGIAVGAVEHRPRRRGFEGRTDHVEVGGRACEQPFTLRVADAKEPRLRAPRARVGPQVLRVPLPDAVDVLAGTNASGRGPHFGRGAPEVALVSECGCGPGKYRVEL